MFVKRRMVTRLSRKVGRIVFTSQRPLWILTILVFLKITYYFCMEANVDTELMSYIFDNELYSFTGNFYVVNTSTCKIPDFDPWFKSVKLTKYKCRTYNDAGHPNCLKRYPRKWMYSDGKRLYVNQSAMSAEGFSLRSGQCCYRAIERVEQSFEKYDMSADRQVRLSKKCHKIHSTEILIPFEFIYVLCMSDTHISSSDIYYRDFFAFPQLSANARSKIQYWKKNKTDFSPNVVILLLDTVSRLNFLRRMPETLKVLREAEAVEFFGYTKVAPGTMSNTIAALGGLNIKEYNELCHPSSKHSQDACPLVWKDFDKAGYLTVLTEDQGRHGLFNYFPDGIGFVRKPTDFYFRPMAISWIKALGVPYYSDYAKCIFQTPVDKFVLQYLMDVFDQNSKKAPLFVHSLFGAFSHDCLDDLQYNDGSISDFLKFIIRRHPNTIVILKGDHGERFGPFHETLMGWYDSKLPVLWIYLPSTVQQRFPTWMDGLQQNTKRLTSHFDTYRTLLQILESYGEFPRYISRHGQSLFLPVPENRTCLDASIPSLYCPCKLPTLLERSENNPRDVYTKRILDRAVDEAIVYLSNTLPSSCAKFHIRNAESLIGAKVQKLHHGIVYHVTFKPYPGDFVFEARVTLTETSDRTNQPKFSIGSLQEIKPLNKADLNISKCMPDITLKKYCYCI